MFLGVVELVFVVYCLNKVHVLPHLSLVEGHTVCKERLLFLPLRIISLFGYRDTEVLDLQLLRVVVCVNDLLDIDRIRRHVG